MTTKKYPLKRPIAIDFFCGAGGMSLGFEQAGFDIALAVDKDGYHVAAHARNFPYGKVMCASVTDLTGADILKMSGISEVDLVFGGPPCQGFSQMGHRDAGDPRNTLVYHFARLITELNPRAFVMENVPGMQFGSTRKIYDMFVTTVEQHGYKVTHPSKTLVASDFGVPQVRERLIVLGLRKDVPGTLEYPDGPLLGQPLRPTIAEAFEGLPSVENESSLKNWNSTYSKKPAKSSYARNAMGLDDDPTDLSRPRLWNRDELSGCKRIRHVPEVVTLYAATEPGKMVPGHKLPKLDPNGIAPTLRAGSDSERGSYTAPRPVHPYSPRVITVREAARLHGYPDWFGFFPVSVHAYRQIGNSVCPPVARAIGNSILKSLKCKTTTRRPAAVVLSDDFTLPVETAKQHKRINQLLEFSKIINHIFEKAKSSKRKILQVKITPNDIDAAAKATGAQLPRVRPERFLDDLSRSRNILKILSLPLANGFSIVKLDGGEGAFVKQDDLNAIHIKKAITVASNEITSAVEFQINSQSRELWASALQNNNHAKLLFGARRLLIKYEADLLGNKNVLPIFEIHEAHRKYTGVALISTSKNFPSFEQILRELFLSNATYALLQLNLTREHVFLASFIVCDGRLKELGRVILRPQRIPHAKKSVARQVIAIT